MIFTTLKGNKVPLALAPFKINWKSKTRSQFQDRVKAFLYLHFRKLDWYEEVSLVGAEVSRLKWDFFCTFKNKKGEDEKVFLEVQGAGHSKLIGKFHKSIADFEDGLLRDELKVFFAEKNSKFPIIEIHPEDEPLTLKEFVKHYPFLPVDKPKS